MKFLRLILPAFLFASIAATVASPAVFADAPVSHTVTNDDKTENPEVLYTRIVTSSLPTITAGPGETVHKEFVVETETFMTDGTVMAGQDVISMSLTNKLVGQVKDGEVITTYRTCSADLNDGEKFYTGGVEWGYNYGNQAWIINGYAIVHRVAQNSNWSVNQHYSTDWSAPSYVVTVNTKALFYKALFYTFSTHRIAWYLTANGSCSATGYLS